MTTLLTLAAGVLAVLAAARSTWSPCGLSMLATVTPLAERARGHRYRTTAAWFIAGGLAGGATLGLGMAGLAVAVRAVGPPVLTVAALAAAASILAAASDAPRGGFQLPVHHRQVNERWLDQFRPWVYGAGFGWQIGAGLVTYIKTTALYLTIVLGALTGRPATALAIGALFGLVRGLAVLLGRRITSAAALAAFHRRFTGLGPVVLGIVLGAELASAIAFAAVVSIWAVLALVLVLVLVAGRAAATGRARRRSRVPART